MSDYGDLQIAGAQDALRVELQQTLGEALQHLQAASGESRVLVPSHLFSWVAELLQYRGARYMSHVATDERPSAESFRVIAIFSLGAGRGLFSIETQLPRSQASYPSLTSKIAAAHWAEQEAQELLHITAEGHPDKGSLMRLPPHQYPLRHGFLADAHKASPEHQTTALSTNPLTSLAQDALRNQARYHLQRDGEILLKVEAQYFQHHRGVEKQIQHLPFEQALSVIERICIGCSVSNAYSFCAALERIRGILAPPRARALRVMALELERVAVHAGNLKKLCQHLSIADGALRAAALKESAHRLSASLFGHRYGMNFFAPGGVRRDVNAEQLRQTTTKLTEMIRHLEALMRAIEGTPEALERLVGLGVLSEEIAKTLGVVGLTGRASGIDLDLRRDHPYDGYQDVGAPQVFSETSGDAATRMKLQVFELKESLQLLQKITAQDLPHSVLHQELGNLSAGHSAIGFAESPQGESVSYVLLGEGNTIARYRLRSASYANALALPKVCLGEVAEDFPLLEHSFGLCAACIDR
jgi:Ni,Fe-hydrogenase III large subunit/Ni,Fe-hydrogenase III component G